MILYDQDELKKILIQVIGNKTEEKPYHEDFERAAARTRNFQRHEQLLRAKKYIGDIDYML